MILNQCQLSGNSCIVLSFFGQCTCTPGIRWSLCKGSCRNAKPRGEDQTPKIRTHAMAAPKAHSKYCRDPFLSKNISYRGPFGPVVRQPGLSVSVENLPKTNYCQAVNFAHQYQPKQSSCAANLPSDFTILHFCPYNNSSPFSSRVNVNGTESADRTCHICGMPVKPAIAHV